MLSDTGQSGRGATPAGGGADDPTQTFLFGQVLESMAEASRAKSIEALHGVFRTVFGQLGFSLWLCLDISNSNPPTAEPLFGEGYERWWQHYSEMGYLPRDPVIQAALAGRDAFFWRDVYAEILAAPHGEAILGDAKRFGLVDGFADVLFRFDNSAFIVLLAGSADAAPNHSRRAATHLVATYYGLLGREILLGKPPVTGSVKLTKRQLECLRWVREGKSSHDISDILGISSDVVDEHIARACSRLGVRTRTQAAVILAMKGYF